MGNTNTYSMDKQTYIVLRSNIVSWLIIQQWNMDAHIVIPSDQDNFSIFYFLLRVLADDALIVFHLQDFKIFILMLLSINFSSEFIFLFC